MTKRYEKFEGWMVGKAVRDDEGDKGVVTREYDGDGHYLWAEWDDFGEAWIDVDSLVFLDVDEGHESEQENKPIPWEVGQEVWDVRYGKGVVDTLAALEDYPVGVVFQDGKCASYTKDGKNRYEDKCRSLFFSEPKIEAELFPPKKKFVPTFTKGETVVAKKKDGQNTVVFYVDKETELSVESTGCGYLKDLYNFYKIGDIVTGKQIGRAHV